MSVGGIYSNTGEDYWVVKDDGTYYWSGWLDPFSVRTTRGDFTMSDVRCCDKLAPKELSQWNDK